MAAESTFSYIDVQLHHMLTAQSTPDSTAHEQLFYRGEKVLFQPVFKNINEKHAFQKDDFLATHVRQCSRNRPKTKPKRREEGNHGRVLSPVMLVRGWRGQGNSS
jgi:hypothetical protein